MFLSRVRVQQCNKEAKLISDYVERAWLSTRPTMQNIWKGQSIELITMRSRLSSLPFRRIRGGQIDVHPTEKALIVNYSIEATVLDEYQNTMIGDKKDAQKM